MAGTFMDSKFYVRAAASRVFTSNVNLDDLLCIGFIITPIIDWLVKQAKITQLSNRGSFKHFGRDLQAIKSWWLALQDRDWYIATANEAGTTNINKPP